MKKFLSLALALLMLLLAFASCTDNSGDDETTETPDNRIVLFEEGVRTEYKVVYPANSKAAVETAAEGLAYQIEQKFKLPENITCSPEYTNWAIDPDPLEILIGDTTREESAEAAKLLTGATSEYVIKLFDNKKLAIVGTNSACVKEGVNYFIATFVTSNTEKKLALDAGYTYVCDLGDSLSASWSISAPKYVGGLLSPSAYSIGTNISLLSGANGGKMHLISETNAEEFNAYLETLKSNGYTQIVKTENNGNIYVQLKKANKLVYTYYTKAFGEVRVIDDYASLPETDFEYTCPDGEVTFYQYGMMHDPGGAGEGQNCDGKWGNNGAFDIIKLPDNKLILIDGGWETQATPKATEELVKFLHEITGTAENEKITVAAWYFTHAHGDHYIFVRNIIRDYSEQFVFERVMHNIPTYMGGGDYEKFGTLLRNAYPGIKFIKLHTGQNITLGNITIDVLMTHEDATDPETGRTFVIDQNNSSNVLKININGKSIMYMGDWGGNDQGTAAKRDEYKEMERRLLTPYAVETGTDSKGNTIYSYPFLKADVVQIAHHAINSWMSKVYNAIDADYAFFTQADVNYEHFYHDCYKTIVDQLRNTGMEDENMYFAGRKTNWLTFAQNGTVTHGDRAIAGVTEGYYYYVDADGKKLYTDADGKVNNTGKGELITDDNGKQTITAEGITGITSKYEKGYWDYLNAYHKDGVSIPMTPWNGGNA